MLARPVKFSAPSARSTASTSARSGLASQRNFHLEAIADRQKTSLLKSSNSRQYRRNYYGNNSKDYQSSRFYTTSSNDIFEADTSSNSGKWVLLGGLLAMGLLWNSLDAEEEDKVNEWVNLYWLQPEPEKLIEKTPSLLLPFDRPFQSPEDPFCLYETIGFISTILASRRVEPRKFIEALDGLRATSPLMEIALWHALYLTHTQEAWWVIQSAVHNASKDLKDDEKAAYFKDPEAQFEKAITALRNSTDPFEVAVQIGRFRATGNDEYIRRAVKALDVTLPLAEGELDSSELKVFTDTLVKRFRALSRAYPLARSTIEEIYFEQSPKVQELLVTVLGSVPVAPATPALPRPSRLPVEQKEVQLLNMQPRNFY